MIVTRNKTTKTHGTVRPNDNILCCREKIKILKSSNS